MSVTTQTHMSVTTQTRSKILRQVTTQIKSMTFMILKCQNSSPL